jgi:hypothetical protein
MVTSRLQIWWQNTHHHCALTLLVNSMEALRDANEYKTASKANKACFFQMINCHPKAMEDLVAV